MKNTSVIFVIIIFLISGVGMFLISPEISYSQGIVPVCNTVMDTVIVNGKPVTKFIDECNTCDLAKLAENLINFMVQISFVISALLFAYAGFLFFTAGADSGKVSNARKIFTNTIIGIVIILTAWLVVNVIISVMTGQGLNPFTEVLCAR